MKTVLEGTIACLTVIVIVALAYGLSWLISIGVMKLICFCFGLNFSLKVATGVWLLLALVGSFFKTTVHKNK